MIVVHYNRHLNARIKKAFLFLIFIYPILGYSQQTVEKYSADSASIEQPGVPKGELIKATFKDSKIFPGTVRDFWVYVPAQYKPNKPACVYVNQDRVDWKAPTVFDNLIYKKEMPVTIGIFIAPGRLPASNPDSA